jgi:tryptophan synthase alpha subunit
VVIGTRLIQEIEAAGPQHAVEKAGAFIRGIRDAMDAATPTTTREMTT